MSQQKKNIFIDASLNSQPWFDDLPIEYQMAYSIHIWIDSNNIGVWKPHLRELYFKLKQEIDPDDFLEAVNSDSKHIEVLDSGDWWLIDYLPLQVRTLTPNNRPHISYIEDLREHGLLTRYAKENPENVKFEVIKELEDWEKIEDFDKKKKAKSAYKYLDSKGLIRPLQEAYKTLARDCQDSKEKDKDKDKEQEKEQEQEKDQEKDKVLPSNDLKASNGVSKKEVSDTVINEKGALFYHKLATRLKDIIPEDVFDEISSEDIESDLKTFHDTLESEGIEQPRDFIITKAKSTDWTGMRWNDFDGVLFETATPF